MRLTAFEKMQRRGVSRLVVADGERILGLISLKDLLQFLNLKLELEGSNEPVDQPIVPREPSEREVALHR